MSTIRIVPAAARDAALVLEMIRGLAEYEQRLADCTATEEQIRETLFGADPAAEVLLVWLDADCAGFAVFYRTYSTFLANPGMFLEDLYVTPEFRGKGLGSVQRPARPSNGIPGSRRSSAARSASR